MACVAYSNDEVTLSYWSTWSYYQKVQQSTLKQRPNPLPPEASFQVRNQKNANSGDSVRLECLPLSEIVSVVPLGKFVPENSYDLRTRRAKQSQSGIQS